MSSFVLFWLAKPIADFLIGFCTIAFMPILAFAVLLPSMWRQARCRHDGGVNETQSCDAICRQCGKNLGFIGAWRVRQRNGK